MSQPAKFEAIDAFRGLAAVMVVLFHSQIYSVLTANTLVGNSYLFVDFFFVLSGFVMAHVYLGRLTRIKEFVPYLILRFGRVYPLHFALLVVWLAYILTKYLVYIKTGLGHDPTDVNNAETFFLNVLLLHAMGFMDHSSWNDPSWSISVEFYTYIVFAIFCLLPLAKAVRGVFALVMALCAYGFMVLLTDRRDLNIVYDFGFLRCIGGFFSGIVVYQLYKWFVEKKIRIKINATLLECVAVALPIGTLFFATQNIPLQLTVICLYTLVVFVFSIQSNGLISKLLLTKPMQLIGKYSYSIYMVHALVLDVSSNFFEYVLGFEFINVSGNDYLVFASGVGFLINVSLILIVIFISHYTYHWIENPYRRKFRDLSKSVELKTNVQSA